MARFLANCFCLVGYNAVSEEHIASIFRVEETSKKARRRRSKKAT
jgi:hypothetical protein